MTALRCCLSLLCLLASLGAARAADRMMIVLDASGSMWAQIGTTSRVEIARTALAEVLADIPAERALGLIAYGHNRKGDCADIETLVAPGPGTAAEIVATANRLNALGKTPLTDAVRQAATALRYTEDRATVVLITDGLETCNADPCAVAAELEAAGVDLTVHVVGFGLSDAEGREVACLAETTGGTYVPAADAAALRAALAATVAAAPEPAPAPAPAPEPAPPAFSLMPTAALSAEDADLVEPGIAWQVLDPANGAVIETGYGTDWKMALPPGAWLLRARLGEVSREMPVILAPGEVARPHAVLEAVALTLRARPNSASDPVDPSAQIRIAYPGGEVVGYGEGLFYLPAGALTLTATIGTGSVSLSRTLAAGTVAAEDLVVGIGHVALAALYSEGGEAVRAPGLALDIALGKRGLDGSRTPVTTLYGPDQGADLAPGDYVLIARMDEARGEVPFTIRAGEGVTATAILNAGVLAIQAAGAERVEIAAGKPNLEGRHEVLWTGYGDTHTVTMPAGAYRVTATRPGDQQAHQPAEVSAGARTDIMVP